MPINYYDTTPAEQPYLSQYVPVPMQALMHAGAAIQDRHDKTKDAQTLLEQRLGNIKVRPEDQPLQDKMVSDTQNKLQDIYDKHKGNFSSGEYIHDLTKVANGISLDNGLKDRMYNYDQKQKYNEERAKLDNYIDYNDISKQGMNGVDEGGSYQGAHVHGRVDFKGFHKFSDHTKPVTEIFDKMKADGSIRDIVNVDPHTGIISGNKMGWEGILRKRMQDVGTANISTFLQSEGGQDFARKMKAQGITGNDLALAAQNHIHRIGEAYLFNKTTQDKNATYNRGLYDMGNGQGDYMPAAPKQTKELPYGTVPGNTIMPKIDLSKLGGWNVNNSGSDKSMVAGTSTPLFNLTKTKDSKIEDYARTPEAEKAYGSVLPDIIKNNPRLADDTDETYNERIQSRYMDAAKKLLTYTPNVKEITNPSEIKAAHTKVLGTVDGDGNYEAGDIVDSKVIIHDDHGNVKEYTTGKEAADALGMTLAQISQNGQVVGNLTVDNPKSVGQGDAVRVMKGDKPYTLIVSNGTMEKNRYAKDVQDLLAPKWDLSKNTSEVKKIKIDGYEHFLKSKANDIFANDGILHDRNVTIYETDSRGKPLYVNPDDRRMVSTVHKPGYEFKTIDPATLVQAHEDRNPHRNNYGLSSVSITGENKALGTGQSSDKYESSGVE